MTPSHVPVQPHLIAGLHITGSGSHGECRGALHHCVLGMQRAQQRVHHFVALDDGAQRFLDGHVGQHGGSIGDGSVPLARQDVYQRVDGVGFCSRTVHNREKGLLFYQFKSVTEEFVTEFTPTSPEMILETG